MQELKPTLMASGKGQTDGNFNLIQLHTSALNGKYDRERQQLFSAIDTFHVQ